RELLDGERAYRKNNLTPPAAPAAPTSTAPVVCKCLAIQSSYVAGELQADANCLRFESAPASAVKYQLRYGWTKVAKVEVATHGANPAIALASNSGDA